MKQLVRELKDLAKLFLSEGEANTIYKYIASQKWHELRLYVGDLTEEYEVKTMVADGDQSKLQEWLMIEKMDDIVTELAIQMNEVDGGKQPKQRERIIRS